MGNLYRLNVVAALLSVIAVCTAARADDVVDQELGYALAVPAGWDRIPNGPLGRAASMMRSPGAAGGGPNFVAGFEPGKHKTYFEYPYVLVQFQPYGNGLSLSTISQSELSDVVTKLTGVPSGQLKNGLSREAASVLRDVSINSPTMLTSPPGFVMGTKLNVRGVGTVRGRSVSLLGRTGAVTVHFYAKEDDWNKYADTAEEFEAGFKRTAGETVTIGDTTRTTSGDRVGGFDWSMVGNKAVIGGIVGGLAGLLGLGGWAKKRSGGASITDE
jgi:hypothetical protein